MTYKFQPLDKSFMGSLKIYYSEEIKMWTRTTADSIWYIMDLVGRAHMKYQIIEIAINGFRITGIYPPNRNIFSDINYISS